MPTIRRAISGDRDRLLLLIDAFYRIDDHPFDRPRVLAGLEPLLSGDRFGQIWVAEDDGEATVGKLVGYSVVTWGWSLESGGLDCILDEIYVERRRSGLGSRLLAYSIDEARRHGARVMALETEAPNDGARRFYRRHGFVDEDSTWMLIDLTSEPAGHATAG
ncbi:MAG: GNAT family N-acetyltransferase [Acidimicrobiales bacterium]